MLVGEVACYMLEVALRRNAWFSYTGILLPGSSDAEDGDALSQAATVYEEWYKRCYDESSSSVVCAEDDLPDVNWDHRRQPVE